MRRVGVPPRRRGGRPIGSHRSRIRSCRRQWRRCTRIMAGPGRSASSRRTIRLRDCRLSSGLEFHRLLRRFSFPYPISLMLPEREQCQRGLVDLIRIEFHATSHLLMTVLAISLCRAEIRRPVAHLILLPAAIARVLICAPSRLRASMRGRSPATISTMARSNSPRWLRRARSELRRGQYNRRLRRRSLHTIASSLDAPLKPPAFRSAAPPVDSALAIRLLKLALETKQSIYKLVRMRKCNQMSARNYFDVLITSVPSNSSLEVERKEAVAP